MKRKLFLHRLDKNYKKQKLNVDRISLEKEEVRKKTIEILKNVLLNNTKFGSDQF